MQFRRLLRIHLFLYLVPCVKASFHVFNEKSRTVYDPAGCMSFSFINCRLCTVDKTLHVDELNKDYIKLARVKGLSSKRIMVTHVLRNAFVPLAQYIPYSILLTVGGSLLVERFFSVPGMGSLLTDAINRYDTNVVQTLVILYAALGIIGVFLGDVLMMIIDPRITLTGKGGTR